MKRTGSFVFVIIVLIALGALTWFFMSRYTTDQQPVFGDADDSVVASGEVLISADGQPALTRQEFEEFVRELEASDPQISFMMQIVPDFKQQLLEMKKRSVIIGQWAEKNKVRDSATYREQKARSMKALDEMLLNQHFIEAHKVEVTDADARAFYDQNKEKEAGLMISPAGVEAKGVKFDNEAAAKAFEQAVKSAGNNIAKAAQEKSAKVNDFGVVTAMSMVAAPVKDVVMKFKTFPSSAFVKAGDKEYWVVVATGSRKAEYQPFGQVKDAIKQRLQGSKIEEMLKAELPKYEEEFKITIDTESLQQEQKNTQTMT